MSDREALRPDEERTTVELCELLGHHATRGSRHRKAAILDVLSERAPWLRFDGFSDLVRQDDEESFHRVGAKWLRHAATSSDELVLWNAAQFFIAESSSDALGIIQRGSRIAPNEKRWVYLRAIGLRGMQRRLRSPIRSTSRLRILALMLDTIHGGGVGSGEWEAQVFETARAAYEAGVLQIADALASGLAASLEAAARVRWNAAQGPAGNLLHEARTLLGMLALQRGEVTAAGERLLQSARVPVTVQLETQGPNPSLYEALEAIQSPAASVFWTVCVERGINTAHLQRG